MPSHLLKVDGLTIASAQGLVINNLSFHIHAGEIVALTGKSGSGKTSIAMAILDLLPSGFSIKEGNIQWCHNEMELSLPKDSNAWSKLRGSYIGFTQQDIFGAFDPVLQIGQQMLMVIHERAIAPTEDIERDLRLKLEEVGLHDISRLWASYPHQLSGGQLQRCQLAMSMVIKPALLITDEPTSAIDKINQLELLDVFKTLKTKYNMAILCITHEEAVVRYLADREIQLDEITKDFVLPDRKFNEVLSIDQHPIVEVNDLEYTHAFGGMVRKKGAMVGKIGFKLAKGMCLGIVGESGSGKSTVAQLLVGLITPDAGQIIIDGRQIDFRSHADIIRLRSKVQLVMQDGRGSLHPHFTIRKILQEIVSLRKEKDHLYNPDLTELLKTVDLPSSVLDRVQGQLSGGECLRISIARALMMDPAVLICDESTSALDGETRDGIIQLLLNLKSGKGLAIIFISHDEHVIRGVADVVMVMDDGKVVESGPADEVIQYPTHEVTKKIFAMRATLEQRGRL